MAPAPRTQEVLAPMQLHPTLVERFWQRVDTSGECWLWTGAKSKRGYGQFYVGRTRLGAAHVISYTLAVGALTPDKPCVLHRCDNPPCVRPTHLFAGTQHDNMRDMTEKGRRYATKGSENPQSRLTELAVREIRIAHNRGVPLKVLAAAHGVCYDTVQKAAKGTTWRHVA